MVVRVRNAIRIVIVVRVIKVVIVFEVGRGVRVVWVF